MKIESEKLKCGIFALFSTPYIIGGYFIALAAAQVNAAGDMWGAGLLAGLSLVLGLTGVGGLLIAVKKYKAPDYLVALHAAVAILFVVITIQR